MSTLKKVLAGLAALAALALGGAAIAGATSGGDEQSDAPDVAVSGADASSAGDAARAALGGGKVVSVEGSDEGGAAVYEVKVDQNGKVTEIQLDEGFSVVARQADDDQPGSHDQGDGDGEADDD
jgi:uncharacterized membrane protein YkoI